MIFALFKWSQYNTSYSSFSLEKVSSFGQLLTSHASAAKFTHNCIKSGSTALLINIGRIKSSTACRYVPWTRSAPCCGNDLESCCGACRFHSFSSERSCTTSVNEGTRACGPVKCVLILLISIYTYPWRLDDGAHSIFDLIRYTWRWCKAEVIWRKDSIVNMMVLGFLNA